MSASPDVFLSLGLLSEPPGPAHARVAEALGLPGVAEQSEHSELFLFHLYPYASVYLGAEGMLGGEAGDRVAGFWRAVGLTPPAEPDHVAALLGLYAGLREAAEAEEDRARKLLRTESCRALLWEHLLSWAVAYARKVMAVAPPFHRAWAELLARALLDEARECRADGPLPLHLRAAPGLPAPEEGGDAFVDALLTPVRSGLILTRWDLSRAAQVAGVGVRMGERRLILRSLFGQDAAATLAWLAEEAGWWVDVHVDTRQELAEIARFWEGRAAATRTVLLEMDREARKEVARAARSQHG
jgi:hypothetical protein